MSKMMIIGIFLGLVIGLSLSMIFYTHRINSLSRQIMRKEEIIQRQQEKIKQLGSLLKEKEDQIKSREKEIEQLKGELEKLKREIDELKIKLKLKTVHKIKAEIKNEFLVSHLYYQGLAEGGGFWYFSYKNALFKTNEWFNETIKALYPAIPSDLMDAGYDHIGDIDHHEGIIYAPVEDKAYLKPIVILYNASDLSYIGFIGPLPQSHLPWVAVDSKGFIYSSEFRDVDEVKVYDKNGILVQIIELNTTLQRVQGGCILYDTYLILSTDDGGDWIYAVDIATGEVYKVIAVRKSVEGEGIECKGFTLYFLSGVPSHMPVPSTMYMIEIILED